jgi:hypothetical protein
MKTQLLYLHLEWGHSHHIHISRGSSFVFYLCLALFLCWISFSFFLSKSVLQSKVPSESRDPLERWCVPSTLLGIEEEQGKEETSVWESTKILSFLLCYQILKHPLCARSLPHNTYVLVSSCHC